MTHHLPRLSSLSRRSLLGATALSAAALTGLGTSGLARAATGYAGVAGSMTWDQLYPVGSAFPMGMYDIGTEFRPPSNTPEPHEPLEAMLSARQHGWNMVHRYPNTKDYDTVLSIMQDTLDRAAEARMGSWIRIPDQDNPGSAYTMPIPTDLGAAYIQTLSASDHLTWWDLPEECRYWSANEMEIMREYPLWTREHDPHQRPTMMYEPNHAGAGRMAYSLEHIDLVGVSAYTRYTNNPHGWVRWKLDQAHQAIAQIGATVGPNYLAGQKNVISALELYSSGPPKLMPTPEGVYHDFWQSIASGAKGVLVYSYYRRLDYPELLDCLDSYYVASEQLTGPWGLDQAALFGEAGPDVTGEVVAGPLLVPPFTPTNQDPVTDMPSLNTAVFRHRGVAHVLLVNSHETESLTVQVSGLRRARGRAQLPFEDDTIVLSNGSFETELPPLGVRYVRVVAG